MVIDTSALLTIVFNEADARSFAEAIDRDAVRLVSVASVLEASMLAESRQGPNGPSRLDAIVAEIGATIVPVRMEHAIAGREALRRFGKGRHPAGLNCGDCFSYALAHITSEPLLCKRNDFTLTDLKVVSLT